MKEVNYPHIVVLVIVVAVLAGILVAGGCGGNKRPAVVRLPDTPRLVGGGMMIEWRAPERGTAYLVEKQTGKIVETRSLEAGEVYSFAATSVVQADDFEQMLGIRFAKARFLLYFEPAGEEGSAAETGEPVRVWSRF